MKKLAGLSLLFGVAACQDATSPRTSLAPRAPARSALAAAISNDYIVTFSQNDPDPEEQARALVAAHGGSLRFVYRAALKGFAVADLPDAAVTALQQNPRVARVERDGVATVDGVQSPVPSWGLDRIDALAGLSASYDYPNDGSGVTAYIIDTGINSGSSDFLGRLTLGPDYDDGGTPEDCNGHGTHVAGTVGGTVHGVAKNVSVVAVRVLNCQGTGSYAAVIAGVDWVAQNHPPLSVANMSLSGPGSASLNQAVAGAVAGGVVFTVAAGNRSDDACGYSPGSEPTAITVGATTSFDQWASYSNYGTCVDINAPGTAITSDWIGDANATATLNGTSMASPHVAGGAALYRSVNPSATPAQVAAALLGGATPGAISGVPPSTANRFLYVGFIASGTGGGGTQLDASFSPAACGGGFVCSFTANATGVSYAWSFTDGGSANTRTVSHTYPKKGGSYTVSLLVSDGSSSASSTQTVSCNPKKGCH
jgi:subtilisin family serine protease